MRLSAREQIHLHSAGGTPVEHVVIANNGWYLFNVLPLACGNAREDAWCKWRFFSDEVNLDKLHNRLTRHAAQKGCMVEGLNVFNAEQVLPLSISVAGFNVPIPYLICYQDIQLSCVFTKPCQGGQP